MARYVEIATEIAEQVRSGRLRAGATLPGVRDAATAFRTTASTIARAHRLLADAGVVTLADRRRARITPAGARAAAHLLDPARPFRLAGSDDPALQIVLDHTDPAVVPVGSRGSFPGLRALSRGDADGAAIHLRHRDGSDNAGYARALLRGRDPHLLRLWRREQGILVAREDAGRIRSVTDLAPLRVAVREHGAGTRVLLDQLFIEHGIDPGTIRGPEMPSHLDVALSIAAGIADAGLGPRASATSLDLHFVPLAWERYDIVLPAEALGAAQPLIAALARAEVRAAVRALDGYDLSDSGTVHRA